MRVISRSSIVLEEAGKVLTDYAGILPGWTFHLNAVAIDEEAALDPKAWKEMRPSLVFYGCGREQRVIGPVEGVWRLLKILKTHGAV